MPSMVRGARVAAILSSLITALALAGAALGSLGLFVSSRVLQESREGG